MARFRIILFACLVISITALPLGTEEPDNNDIPSECNAPNTGYDDRRLGHSVEWNSDFSGWETNNGETKDRAARRAQEEYKKAVRAFDEGNLSAVAFYLGAMAHYVGAVSQYGHSYPNEVHHSDYERWVQRRTRTFSAGHFESYIVADGLRRRRAPTAVKRISKVTARGRDSILSATTMDSRYSQKDQAYMDSVGHSLNFGVNELADVRHTFYLNVVAEEQ